jgi:hypothetical protein
VIAAGLALIGVGFGLTAMAHTVPALAVTVVLWTFGEMIAAPVGSAYVAELSPEHLRGRYLGLWLGCAVVGRGRRGSRFGQPRAPSGPPAHGSGRPPQGPGLRGVAYTPV